MLRKSILFGLFRARNLSPEIEIHNKALRYMSDQSQARVQQTMVFDKKVRIKHLDVSASNKEPHVYDYLRDYVSKELCDRLEDLKIDSKQTIMNIGCCSGLVAKNINPERVESLIQADISVGNLSRCRSTMSIIPPRFPVLYILFDEESIPIRESSIDLVMSCLDFHWVNDLASSFNQIFSTLRDNKPFMGAMFGGDTLFELRSSLQLAELERLSGFSSHVAPKTSGQDVARLLQSSGFQLITVDISEIVINYPSIFELMFDLQGMGENNSSIIGSKHMHRDVLVSAGGIYHALYGSKETKEGVPATYQVIHFIGWKNPTKSTPLKTE